MGIVGQGRLVVVGNVEYGKSDGICGGADGRLVVAGNVDYGKVLGYGRLVFGGKCG